MTEIKYPDILHSVYHIMADGKQYKIGDLLPLVQKACAYTDEQMKEMTKEGTDLRVKKYIAWAITHLHGAGLIRKVARGLYEIVPSKDQLLTLNAKNFKDLVFRMCESKKAENTKTQKNNTIEHNVVTIAKAKKFFPKLSENGNDWMLNCLCFMDTAPDRDTIRKGIGSLLVDAKDEMTIEELQEILEEAKAQRKLGYKLIVKMENKGNKKDPKIIVDFTVQDDNGQEYPLKFESLWKAIYLTFLCLEEGTNLMDFCDATKQPNKIFQKIYDSLSNKKGTSKAVTFDPENDKTEILMEKQETLTQNISKIRSKIVVSLPNDRAAREFVISDKDKKSYYSIRATNKDIRDNIKKTFNLK